MSSSSAENETVGEHELENDALVMDQEEKENSPEAMDDNDVIKGGRIADILAEERAAASSPLAHENGINGRGYKNTHNDDDASEASFQESIPRRPASPMESETSVPDDTPSVQVLNL